MSTWVKVQTQIIEMLSKRSIRIPTKNKQQYIDQCIKNKRPKAQTSTTRI